MIQIDLNNKVAIVTGSGSGMGKVIATKLAEADASVLISDINRESANAASEELKARGLKAEAVQTDVTKQADAEQMVQAAIDRFGTVDILVNNAGIAQFKHFVDIEERDWDRMFNVNVKGVYFCTKAVVPHLINKRSGKIVTISSMVGKEGFALLNHYSASKFAVIGMTQGLAKELAPYDINVNAVCPGIVKTNMWGPDIVNQISKATGTPDEQVWDGFIDGIPFKRPQTPEDIAHTVAFLASDLSKNITGQALNVSGGAVTH